MGQIIKEGRSSYGACWIEDVGYGYKLYIGGTYKGLYSNLQDALREFEHWCY